MLSNCHIFCLIFLVFYSNRVHTSLLLLHYVLFINQDEYCNIKCNIVLMQLLTSKFSGVVTTAAKGRCWEELAREVSAVWGIARRATARKSMRQTGGDEMMEGVTASHQRVSE